MSMYLSNDELRSTGLEPAEYLDVPPMAATTSVAPTPAPGGRGFPAPLDDRTRYVLTRWAEDYIAALVHDRDGGIEDVRAVVRALHRDLATAAAVEG